MFTDDVEPDSPSLGFGVVLTDRQQFPSDELMHVSYQQSMERAPYAPRTPEWWSAEAARLRVERERLQAEEARLAEGLESAREAEAKEVERLEALAREVGQVDAEISKLRGELEQARVQQPERALSATACSLARDRIMCCALYVIQSNRLTKQEV